MSEPIVSARGLRKEFDEAVAVDSVDLDIERGSVTALVGPNGAGKTTLMRLLCGLTLPDAGTVRVCGIDAGTEPRRVRSRYGFLPDVYGMREEMTPRNHLLYFAEAYRMTPAQAHSRTAEVVAFTGLDAVCERPLGTLSRGQRQRVGIARAMLHDPPLILLDEPSAGLDPEARRDLQLLFKESARRGTTLVVSSHILTELEDYCTHAVLMRRGRVVVSGPIDEFTSAIAPVRVLRVAHGADEAEALLRARGAGSIERSGRDFRFSLSGDEKAAAELLGALVAAGIGVCSYALERRRFEDAYHGWSAALPEEA
ncbi:MAG: ABC transporter ATP-binding protein [Elusimicrobia bacterium]|nr:ABC transporter ATP-binding protein [Elusimicrobiota bacterium]